MSRQRRRAAGSGRDNRFRIIGGAWRGRRLEFPDIAELRPSPDRVRETLFAWLAPVIRGARCVDLCAGSGALGLEALSRGAAHVVFVDVAPAALAAIRDHLALLGASERATLVPGAAEAYLASAAEGADVYFVDPPFAGNRWDRLCTLIDEAPGSAVTGSLVYLEHPADRSLVLPSRWKVVRRSRAGRVGYELARTATE